MYIVENTLSPITVILLLLLRNHILYLEKKIYEQNKDGKKFIHQIDQNYLKLEEKIKGVTEPNLIIKKNKELRN